MRNAQGLETIPRVYGVVTVTDAGELLEGVYLNLGHALNKQTLVERKTGKRPEVRHYVFDGTTETPDGVCTQAETLPKSVKLSETPLEPITARAVPVDLAAYRAARPFVESVCGLKLDKRW